MTDLLLDLADGTAPALSTLYTANLEYDLCVTQIVRSKCAIVGLANRSESPSATEGRHSMIAPGSRTVIRTLLAVSALQNVALARDNGQWEATAQDVREWYRNLRQPDHPRVSCCGEADAYWADSFKVEDGKTVAIITDTRDDAPLRRPHIAPGTRVVVPD